MKKQSIFLGLVLAAAIVGGGIYLQTSKTDTVSNEIVSSEKDSSQQNTNDLVVSEWAKNQNEKEVKTSSKKALDFSAFKSAMDSMSSERVQELDRIVLEASVSDLQKALDDKSITSVELVTYYLKRIEAYDVNKLNSIITLNSKALERAMALDSDRFSTDVRSSLYGLPVLLKDNIATGDHIPNTAGAKALENSLSKKEAHIVTKLREQGAIVLGKANLSEWSNFMTSNSNNGYSALGGQTHNPYGTFDVGGSSSGPAASVSANLSALAIGTETSGSLIYPSGQNSVVALKPTWSLWSTENIIPIADSQDTAGPTVRHVEDAAALLYALTDNEKYKGKDYKNVLDSNYLKGKKIAIATGEVFSYLQRSEDKAVLENVRTELEKLGAEVVEVEIPMSAFNIDSINVLKSEFKYGVNAYLKSNDIESISSIEDLIAYNKEDLENRAPLGQDLIESAQKEALSEDKLKALVASNRTTTRTALDEALKDVDAIFSISNHLSGIYAAAGYPALTVPAGYRGNNEPIGVTFVGRAFEDDKLLSIGYAYEMGTKHRDIEKQTLNDK